MSLSRQALSVVSLAAALSAAAGARAQNTWYVKVAGSNGNGTSWATSFNNLDSAMSAAISGDTICIGAGTYRPSVQRDVGYPRSKMFQIKGGVKYLGGFPAGGGATRNAATNITVLSGDLSNNDTGTFGNVSDNSYHVVYLTGNQLGTVIDGFTISGGYADDQDFFDYAQGGGVLLSGSIIGVPTIRSCVIRNNHAMNQGGGINGGALVVVNSTIYNNRTSSSGEGGGANVGGASFIGCSFLGNNALHGGGLNQGTTAIVLLNCFFSGNHANASDSTNAGLGGGAMLLNDSNTLVNSCTFAGNVATALTGVDQFDSQGGGIYIGGGVNARIYNTILWDNTRYHVTTVSAATQDQAAQLYASGTLPTTGWDIIQNLGAGIGTSNLSSNPMLVGPRGADNTYGTLDDSPAIGPTSPAIDSANGTLMPLDTYDANNNGITNEVIPVDVLGQHRYVDQPSVPNTGVGGLWNDRGAYELQSTCYANCDGSTTPPVLNVLDFTCFLNRFAAGCS